MRNKLAHKSYRLLENSPEAYYWAGFLAADGSIGRGGKHLCLTLADHDHVKKFAEFIGWAGKIRMPVQGKYSSVAFSDAAVIPEFSLKYQLRQRKTFDPPISLFGEPDCKFAFAIGFVDGDGRICKQSGDRRGVALIIKCHSSWLPFIQLLGMELGEADYSHSRINAKGYAYLAITENQQIKELHKRAISLNLPLLQRKWECIDHGYTSRREIGYERIAKAREMLESGMQKKVVAAALGISGSCLRWITKRNGIKTYEGRLDRQE